MKITTELKNLDKKILFDTYAKLTESFKDFEKIETEEIIKEIENTYNNYQNIIEICTYEELEYLKKIIKKKEKQCENKDIEVELQSKLLITKEENKIKIMPPFLKSIKKAIKKVNKKEKTAIDDLNQALIGLVKIYGIAPTDKVIQIIQKKIGISEEIIKNIIKNNKYFNYYTYKIILEKEYILFEPYYYFEEDLINSINRYKEIDYKDVSLEEMIASRYELFDYKKENIKNFLDKISEYNFNYTELLLKILEVSTLDYKREDLIEYILNIKELKNINQNELINLLEKAMNDMPSAPLKGYTPNEISQKILKEEYEKKYKTNLEKTKENEMVQDYKSLRIEVEEIFEECVNYIIKNNALKINKIYEILIKNNISPNFENANVLNSLLFFHKIEDNNKLLFSEFIENGMNILSKKYKLAWQIEENIIESIFQIKKLKPEEGTVKLQDINTKKEYIMYDLAFSSGDKNMIGSFLYTTLITINKFTFANGYAFIFLKEKHQDIMKDIEKIKKTIVETKNEKLKTFLSCWKMFETEDIVFTARPLE